MKATSVLSIDLKEASAKVRTGGPKDDAEDYELPIWAGVLPLTVHAGEPIDDPKLTVKVDVPASVKRREAELKK